MANRIRYCIGLILLLAASADAVADEDCASCHASQHEAWQSSHHAMAMQHPGDHTVLGDFSGTALAHHGQKVTFSRDQGFQVALKDAVGRTTTYRVAYTFGSTPLQQYLVETQPGRYQVLPFAWDSRDKASGGQKWFYMSPDEYLPPGDRLHWKQPLHNWNGMCADCHSTGLERGYDAGSDTFKTRFQTVNVSCSSCHAGASDHAARKKAGKPATSVWQDDIVAYLRDLGGFALEDGQQTASWQGPLPRHRPEMDVCAACHSLRAPLTDGVDPAEKFLDQFSPSLLDDPLYFADGQIRDEVFVWGSFQQSKMFQKGVSCFDCHDSHSLKLKAEGNAVCTQCHNTSVFDQPSHHHHKAGSKGAECVSCHMPERTYMVVDQRRDHSFKVPRPDISAATGSPNACTSCHTDQTDSWAASMLKDWHPLSKQTDTTTMAIHQARQGDPAARAGLHALIANENKPAITRATALSLIPRVATQALVSLAAEKLQDSDPLIRIGAVRALAVLPAESRNALVRPLLTDPLKAVRIEAARALIDSPNADLTAPAFAELFAVDKMTSWRGEGRLNLSQHALYRGDLAEAEKQYRQSLRQDPAFSPALVNLSELLRQTGLETEALDLLKSAAAKPGADGNVLHALGLALVRAGKQTEALAFLKQATEAAPEAPRYAYVYLVALHSLGQTDAAYRGVKAALEAHPFDVGLLRLASSLAATKGDPTLMQAVNRKLSAIQGKAP